MPLCECGCGQEVGYFNKTKTYRNQKKGDPKRFVSGHNTRMFTSEEQSRRGKHNEGYVLSGTGNGKAYPKYHGRHVHRVIAEQKLGRALLKGEVVHHINGNKLNNDPGNIEVLSSQAIHASQHFIEYHAKRRELRGAKI